MPRLTLAKATAFLAATSTFIACESTTTSVASVVSVAVDPSQLSVIQGETAQLRAVLRDQAGNLLSGRVVSWSSGLPSVASVDPTGLVRALGSGSASVTATSEGVSSVAHVVVRSPATIQFDANEVDFQARRDESDPDAQSVAITNTGEAALVNLVVSTAYLDGGPEGWLATSLQSTTAPTSVSLSASLTGLDAGVHQARVDVRSEAASNSPHPITVTFTVLEPPPVIDVSTQTVLLEAPETSVTPVTAPVLVTNAGGSKLSDLQVAVDYTGGQPTGWLEAALEDDTAPTQLTLSATAGALAPGAYMAAATISAPSATNTPLAISVTFTVVPRAAAPPGT